MDVVNRLLASAPGGDQTRDIIESQMKTFLKNEIMGAFNRWGFCPDSVRCVIYNPSQGGNKIEMSFSVMYYCLPTRRYYSCNIWMVFQAKTEGSEKVFSLTRAGLAGYRTGSDSFEGECMTKFQKYFGNGIHISQYNPTEADKNNVVHVASSQFMNDVVGKLAPIFNPWGIRSLESATGTIEGSTIHVDLKVEMRKYGSSHTTHPTFRLSFQMDHHDSAGGKYFRIVDFKCDNDIDGKEALRDRVISSFTNSPAYVGPLHPDAAKDVADKDLAAFKLFCFNDGKNAWHIKSAEVDSEYADQNHLYVCIKLTREGGFDRQGNPTMTYESTLILNHLYIAGGDGGSVVFASCSATVETNGCTDITLAALTTGWTVFSSFNSAQLMYDKNGHYQGDVIPPPHAALEAQAGITPAAHHTVASHAGLALHTHLAPLGAFSPRTAKPVDSMIDMNDSTSNGLTDAYFASLCQQAWKGF